MAGPVAGSKRQELLPGFDALIAASSSIGADLLLVQGGGGDSSLKTDDTLLVKASGFWLRDARERRMFVQLDLAAARSLARAGAEKFDAAVLAGVDGGDLRPSIETGLHALMPHRYVLHAHPVNAIAASVSFDAATIRDRMAGLAWTTMPYVKPGPDLGLAFDKALTAGAFDIVLLANHGAVAGGATADEAEARLREVERRLTMPRADVAQAVQPTTAPPAGYRWLVDDAAAAVAMDPRRADMLSHGALVPDQVVYLGGPAAVVGAAADVAALADQWVTARGVAPGLVLVAGLGALVRADLTAAGLAMVGLLSEIALRLPSGARPSTLRLEDELSLLNWEAEKYRQGVDRSRN